MKLALAFIVFLQAVLLWMGHGHTEWVRATYAVCNAAVRPNNP